MAAKKIAFEGRVGNSSLVLYEFDKPYTARTKNGREYTVNKFGHDLKISSIIRKWVSSFGLKKGG